MTAGIECSLEMDVDHFIPFLLRHIVQHPIPKNTLRVDQYVDLAEGIHAGIDESFRGGEIAGVLEVGDGGAASLLDVGGSLLRRWQLMPLLRLSGDPIDHDLGALGSQRQRYLPADAPASAGDYSIPILQPVSHVL